MVPKNGVRQTGGDPKQTLGPAKMGNQICTCSSLRFKSCRVLLRRFHVDTKDRDCIGVSQRGPLRGVLRLWAPSCVAGLGWCLSKGSPLCRSENKNLSNMRGPCDWEFLPKFIRKALRIANPGSVDESRPLKIHLQPQIMNIHNLEWIVFLGGLFFATAY